MKITSIIFTCEKNLDILEACLPSMKQVLSCGDAFVATDTMPESAYAVFKKVGIAESNILQAGIGASWVDVARHAVSEMERQQRKTILSILDDFHFSWFDRFRFVELFEAVDSNSVSFVRLANERPRLALLFANKQEAHPEIAMIREVPADNPYKHSLSLPIIRIDYFKRLLSGNISIWDFETLPEYPDVPLYYTPDPPCEFKHVVEKGRIGGNTNELFKNIETKGNRPQQSKLAYMMVNLKTKLVFFIVGYFFMNRRMRSAAK